MNARDDLCTRVPGCDSSGGSRIVIANRLSADCAGAVPAACSVVEEDVLTIDIEGVGLYSLMWTPAEGAAAPGGFVAGEGVLGEVAVPERLALALGFAFTEGIVSGLSDIATMALCPERPDVVRMRLFAPERVVVKRRDVTMTSACGACGGREALESGVADLPRVGDTLRLAGADFALIMEAMRRSQTLYGSTGGAHAAAVFSPARRIVAAAEDLGRHNALDKVIGQCLLQGQVLAGCGVVLSSRLSFEMVAKAARAGFEVVAAVSAPTSLAIDVAERLGITLCGFVRGDRATVYTHPRRIRECAAAAPAGPPPAFVRRAPCGVRPGHAG